MTYGSSAARAFDSLAARQGRAVGVRRSLARVVRAALGLFPSSDGTNDPPLDAASLAAFAAEVDAAILEFLGDAKALRRMWEAACQAVASEAFDPHFVAGTTVRMLDLFKRSRRLQKAILEVVKKLEYGRRQLVNAARLRKEVNEVRRLERNCMARWAHLDEAVVRQAQAEHAAGDYPTAGEALADLLAARLAARIMPPYADLKELAERSPPPPEWYEEGPDPA